MWLVKRDGTAKRVGVKTGIQDDRYAEVLSGGLRDGDAVAIAHRVPTAGPAPAPPSFAGMRH